MPRNRRVYPVIFIDAMVVKVRDGQVANKPVYVVIGVTVDGERDILGLWAGDGREGAKFWLSVFTEIKNRGVQDVCIGVGDGLRGLPEATRRCVRERLFRAHSFASYEQANVAWEDWNEDVARRRVHGTHGEVVAVRAGRDRDALGALPAAPYLVVERTTRIVARDGLFSFEGRRYAVSDRGAGGTAARRPRARGLSRQRWQPSRAPPPRSARQDRA